MRFSDFWLIKEGRLTDNYVMVDQIDVMKQLGKDLLAKIAE